MVVMVFSCFEQPMASVRLRAYLHQIQWPDTWDDSRRQRHWDSTSKWTESEKCRKCGEKQHQDNSRDTSEVNRSVRTLNVSDHHLRIAAAATTRDHHICVHGQFLPNVLPSSGVLGLVPLPEHMLWLQAPTSTRSSLPTCTPPPYKSMTNFRPTDPAAPRGCTSAFHESATAYHHPNFVAKLKALSKLFVEQTCRRSPLRFLPTFRGTSFQKSVQECSLLCIPRDVKRKIL